MATITGTSNNDVLVGTADNDTILGLGGNDRLDGGAGADRMEGGLGDDVIIVDNAADDAVELAGEGRDTVYALIGYTLAAGSSIEVLSTYDHGAVTAINLAGNALANELWGNAGANRLDGGAGADILNGLGGDDIYIVDVMADQVNEGAGQGRDTVYALSSYDLGAFAQVEVLSTWDQAATTAINLTGNMFDNELWGNAGANLLNAAAGNDIIYGLGGNDWMFGQLGNDRLDGGTGNDRMEGGAGDDLYFIDAAGDEVIELAGEGRDVAFATASFTLSAGSHVEVLSTYDHGAVTAINLTGNEFANELWGNASANRLDGRAGNDIMNGLGGDDIYFVDGAGDLVNESIGGGRDTIYVTTGYTLAAAAAVEVLSTIDHGSTTTINLSGNDTANELWGNSGANALNGSGGNDTLYGLGGGDTLTGGSGADGFAFTTALGVGNVDLIQDFTPGVDRILLAGVAGQPFAALASGLLGTGSLVIGSTALQADDYLLYNQASGALLFDSDGNGAGVAVQFATLTPGLDLTAADFLVLGPANHLPVFSSGTTATVVENSPVGTIVYQAATNDPDGDAITYSLGGQDAVLFTIDASGAVRLISPADFEMRSSYSITIIAGDSAPTDSTQSVLVSVTNVAEGPTPIINEAEANNAVGTANNIDRAMFTIFDNPNLSNSALPSATIQGDLPNASDRDFFKISLRDGELLVLDVDNSGGNLDTMIRVYNSLGQELAFNDDPGFFDSGSDPHPIYGHNTDSFIRFRAPADGDYYFSIESFQDPENPTSGTYQLNVSIGPVATAAEILAEDVQALLSGFSWPDTQLTYAFPNSYTDFPVGFGDGEATATSGFEQFSASQQAAVQQMLAQISQVSGLTFQQIIDASGSTDGSADLRYAESNVPEVAYAYLPTGDAEGGSAWFNHVDFNAPILGSYDWMGILHETGHALGLKHGHEAPAISFDHDSLEYSVMTYRSYPGASVDDGGGYTNEQWGYPQSLMMLDIAALQQMYGANFSHNAGDTVYRWSPTTGQMFIDGVGQGLPGDGAPSANRIFLTVWDGGGVDTYDFSNYSTGLTIDLRPGEWTKTSDVQLANLGDGNRARGNIANALLFEGDPRSLIENAIGGTSGDWIIANQASNRLTGGGGEDWFQFFSLADCSAMAPDTITDFVSGSGEKIGLERIDANTNTEADDAFSFIGTNAFTGVAGQLRYDVAGGSIHIFGDVNGDAVADLHIIVNSPTISIQDFFL